MTEEAPHLIRLREYRSSPEMFDNGRLDALGRKENDAPPRRLDVLSAASLAGLDVPRRSWIVPDLVPDHQVTILTGDGGVGKSLLALQLAVAIATATDWVGLLPAVGPVIYFGAEDELDEMHRRLVDIVTGNGARLEDCADLHIASLAGHDAILAAPDGTGGMIEMTQLWHAVEGKIKAIRPRLLIVDNSADAFAGNEISRPQVRQFVGALRGAAIRNHMAVLLLSHPSLGGIASGTGTSGSTAWSNSVRSRLYLDRPKAADGAPIDPDARVLRVMKVNYGATGAETKLRWQAGMLRLDGGDLSGTDRPASEARAEDTFIELLERLGTQGRDVSHKPSSSYAPTVFAREPNNGGLQKRSFERAMAALFNAGAIRVETFGPPSKQRSRIVMSAT